MSDTNTYWSMVFTSVCIADPTVSRNCEFLIESDTVPDGYFILNRFPLITPVGFRTDVGFPEPVERADPLLVPTVPDLLNDEMKVWLLSRERND